MIDKSLKLTNIGNLVSYNSKKETMVSKKRCRDCNKKWNYY